MKKKANSWDVHYITYLENGRGVHMTISDCKDLKAVERTVREIHSFRDAEIVSIRPHYSDE